MDEPKADAVLVWSAPAPQPSSLTAWTRATGAHVVSRASIHHLAHDTAPLFAVSADGARVAFIDGIGADAATGDVVVASIDGTGATKLLASVPLLPPCEPHLRFAGERVLVSHCAAGAETTPHGGSEPLATVSSFGGAGWERRDLLASHPGFWIDPHGQWVLAIAHDGVLEAARTDGSGTPHAIDTGVHLVAGFTPDGGSIVYGTSTTAIRISRVAEPAPVTLVSAGLTDFFYFDRSSAALSPDGAWVAYCTECTPDGVDVHVAPTQPPSPRAPGAAELEASPVAFAQAWTADSSRLVWANEPRHARALLRAGAPHGRATADVAPGALFARALSGDAIVFGANETVEKRSHGDLALWDVEVAHVASARPPAVVATRARDWLATHDRARIVYVTDQATPGETSLWIAPIP